MGRFGGRSECVGRLSRICAQSSMLSNFEGSDEAKNATWMLETLVSSSRERMILQVKEMELIQRKIGLQLHMFHVISVRKP